jgi:hypothetical protein
MASGIGSFLGGLAQGYQTSQEMEQRQQAIERDKERMALDKDRFALEKTRAEREAQMGELARQQTEMQINAAKREEEFQNNLKSELAAFANETKAGYEAEEVSPDGKTVAFRRFQDGPSAVAEAKSRGNQFRPGSLKRVAEMDELDKQLQFADRFNSVLARHGKLTPEMMDAARNRRKDIQSEGAVEAARYFMATGDVAGAKNMFKKNGKISIGDDVMLEVVPDEFVGSRIVGSRMVDGKKVQVFDMFQDVILPSMSPAKYTEMLAEMKKTGVIQKHEDVRTDKKISADITMSRESNKAAMDREIYRARKDIEVASMKGKDEKDSIGKQLRDIMFPLAEKQASQPGFVFNADYYRKNTLDQLNRARNLYESGKVRTLEEAAAAAVREIPYNPPK